MDTTTILHLGSTGPTGQHVLKMALDKGYKVTTLVRDPSKLTLKHNNLKVVKGDVRDRASVESAVAGCTCVISTLGVGSTLKSHDLMFSAVSNIIPAMDKAHITRLVFLSAFGVGPTVNQANFLQRFAYRTVLKNIYYDKNRADELIRQSKLDYTLVCPVKLTNGPLTNNYQAGEKMVMKGFPVISRSDVADFLVSQVAEKNYLRKTVIVKNL